MRYHFSQKRARRGGSAREQDAVTDELLLEFLGYPTKGKGSAEVEEILREYLDEADSILSEMAPEMNRGPVRPRIIMPKASTQIELCQTCTTLNDAVAKGARVAVPTPLSKVLDEMKFNPSSANPLRCCVGCGHVMNESINIRKPDTRLPDANVCCRGMQRGVRSGIVRLSQHKSFISASFISVSSTYRLRFEHCGWCGMWIQLLHHARTIGANFVCDVWNRHHSRLIR